MFCGYLSLWANLIPQCPAWLTGVGTREICCVRGSRKAATPWQVFQLLACPLHVGKTGGSLSTVPCLSPHFLVSPSPPTAQGSFVEMVSPIQSLSSVVEPHWFCCRESSKAEEKRAGFVPIYMLFRVMCTLEHPHIWHVGSVTLQHNKSLTFIFLLSWGF